MSHFEDNAIQRMLAIAIFTATFIFPGSVVGVEAETEGEGDGYQNVNLHFNRDAIDAWDIDVDKDEELRRTPIHQKCAAFSKDYIKYAGEFARCELKYAVPFRMCGMCVDKYVITSSTFNDLVTDGDLEKCSVGLMKSDRVQIFPMVEQSMEDIWEKADCAGCFENLSINHTTKQVSYEHPARVSRFMELFNNLSICMNSSLEALIDPATVVTDPNNDVCDVCLENYTALNKHYNDMSSHYNGDVCMDIVDRMNYTRIIWSNHFNCSCRPNQPAAVIVIALIIASTPLFFYIIVRVTGKEKKNKLLKQKRLNMSGQSSSGDSMQQSLWRPNHYQNYQSMEET